MNKQLTENDIQSVERFVLDELKKEYTRRDPKALNMPGIETILILLASKVVLPVVVSIAGKLGYDIINDWRKGKIEKEEIVKQATSDPAEGPGADKNKVVADIIDDLKKDGIPEGKARELIDKTFDKLKPFYNP